MLESEENKRYRLLPRAKGRMENRLKFGKVIEEGTQTAAENQEQNTSKRPNKPHQDFLAFSETGKILLFKSRTYKVSVSIGLHSLHMSPIVFVFSLALVRAS